MKTASTWIVLPLLLALFPTPSAADEPEKPAYEPTSNYPQREIQGWTVYVNHRLLEDQKKLGDKVLQQLRVKLYDINRAVPVKALEKLHQIPIWVEFKHPRNTSPN